MKNTIINIAIVSCFALSTTLVQADPQNSQRHDRNITNETTSGGTWIGKPGSAEPQENANFNDAEIVHILVTANKIDIENGALAKKRTSNNDVLVFAARMVKEHAELMKLANDLISKLKLRSQDNAVSESLEAAGEQNLNKLKYFSDRKFEKNYIDAEIKFHQKLIHLADTVLLPNVKNEELKAMLITVRPVLVSHLEHAQNIQKSIDIDER